MAAVEESTGRTSYCTVTVSITDLNDNAPQFTLPSYNGSVSEAALRGDLVTLTTIIKAVDLDSEQFGMVQYSIKGGQNM